MITYILKRLGWGVFVMVAALTAVFFLMDLVGDPAAAALGPRSTEQARQAWRRENGYDKPAVFRYLKYMGGLLHGDLQKSNRTQQPVGEVVFTRLPRTVLLGAIAMCFELCIGLIIGVFAAVRRNTWFDTGVMATAFVGISAPTFLTGILFLNVLAFRLGWFPVGGYGVTFLDHIAHAILPAITLAIIGAATYARIMRTEMAETLRSDYVRTARAKGLSPVRVVLAHGVRNAMLPIVTLIGLDLSLLVSGAIITEYIYAWPGIGRLAIEALTSRDDFVVLGIVMIACATVQVGNLLADLAIAGLDPRIRMGGT